MKKNNNKQQNNKQQLHVKKNNKQQNKNDFINKQEKKPIKSNINKQKTKNNNIPQKNQPIIKTNKSINNNNNNNNNNKGDEEKRNLWNPKPFGDSGSNEKSNNDTVFQKLDQHLKGSRFRWLNEMLYTNDSDMAFDEFKKDPSLFEQYHDGFKSQVEHWPINPLDLIIGDLKKMTEKKIIADFGCGEAKLAESLEYKHTIHSFDLVAKNERVVACDIKNVPLEDKSVDIVVFCLSLMGTNFLDFITEANRVLKVNGKLMIAEIESRITDNNLFINEISNLEFKLNNKNLNNKYFFLYNFTKVADIVVKKNGSGKNNKFNNNIDSSSILKPCLYKKR